MDICIGAIVIWIILGITVSIFTKDEPSKHSSFDMLDPDKLDPYESETLLAILEDDADIIDWTGDGPGL